MQLYTAASTMASGTHPLARYTHLHDLNKVLIHLLAYYLCHPPGTCLHVVQHSYLIYSILIQNICICMESEVTYTDLYAQIIVRHCLGGFYVDVI